MEFRIKPDKLYIYVNNKPYEDTIIKIIIFKDKLCRYIKDDDDYWNYKINKIKSFSDWIILRDYIIYSVPEECIQIQIYNEESRTNLKRQLNEVNIFIIDNQPLNLLKIRENKDLYKKFSRYWCYKLNYGHCDSETFAPYYSASRWFKWFILHFTDYFLPIQDSYTNFIKINTNCIEKILFEPEIMYDYENIKC